MVKLTDLELAQAKIKALEQKLAKANAKVKALAKADAKNKGKVKNKAKADAKAKAENNYDDDIVDDIRNLYPDIPEKKTERIFHLHKSFKNYLRSWVVTGREDDKDLMKFFENVEGIITQKLLEELNDLTSIKYQLCIQTKLEKFQKENLETAHPYFRNIQSIIRNPSDISSSISKAQQQIQEKLEKWTHNGSGWQVEHIEKLYLDISKYEPFKGGSYIKTPKYYSDKKAIINVQNKDDNCLRWALKSWKFPAETHSERPTKYPSDDGFNFTGISTPTPISEISKVEKMNNLAINVFGNTSNNKSVMIYRVSEMPKEIPRINLFLITIKEKGMCRSHYTWIKNLNRLLHDQTKHNGKKFFCERCLQGYSKEKKLEDHKINCEGAGNVAVKCCMPSEDKKKLYFKNYQNMLKAPYVIYADFESINKPIENADPNPNSSFTTKKQEHEACGYCFIAVRSDGKTRPPKLYRGENAAEHFLKAVQEEQKLIRKELEDIKPIAMTKEDKIKFDQATECWICNKKINTTDGQIKVRDHCHITGEYRGAAHSNCNLKLRITPKTPIYLHNSRNYDTHLLMQAISKVDGNITCIPNNMEKYMTFSLGDLVFKDSFQFLGSSLDSLVKANKPEDFEIFNDHIPEEYVSLLLRKGIYPYNHMKSWDSFEETKLPPIECFYNDLREEGISQEEYNHALEVWNTLGCENLGTYHDIYLITDVLLLADVFEIFRKKCLDIYGLDPAYYISAPGLSWDALFKTTEVNVELLTDYDMLLFIEKGRRGGISMVSKRYAEANNKYLENFDPEKPSNYLLYLDANNLYGWAMSQPLPIGDYKWVEKTDDVIENIMKIPIDSEKGYILETDLEYPEEYHEEHNSYPLAPESLCVEKEWLSEYQLKLLGEQTLHKVKKLVPNLRNKEKYVLHYRNLQLYLSLGMKLTKVHRILEFTQSPWMKPYIEMNTELRKKCTSDFEKNLYKLMNNSVYGKTMENIRNRIDVKLIRESDNDNRLRKLIVSPLYHEHKIFDYDLAAVHMNKSKITFDKPIQVGMAILDLSKLLMYDFYYNKLKAQYGSKCQLLYTDTDSLLLDVQTEDVYQDMKNNIDWYDTSDYPKDHFLFSEKHKKAVGKFKDECSGKIIEKYTGLRPKMYCVKVQDKEIKKAKGVKKYIVQKEITSQQYEDSLFHIKSMRHQMNTLRSSGHHIYGERINKTSLNPLDTKRFIDENGVDTLAYGHKNINKKINNK